MRRQLWACLVCPRTGWTMTTGEPPTGWREVSGRLMCPHHPHEIQAFRDTVSRLPTFATFGWAGGMYWLERANGHMIQEVDAHPTPYEALMAWAREQT